MNKSEEIKSARELIDVDVDEVSLVDSPAIKRPFLITKRAEAVPVVKGAQAFREMGYAPLDYDATPEDARKQVEAWADGDPEKFAQAFLWSESDDPKDLEGFGLQFADVVDGELVAVPKFIFAIAAVLDIVSDDKSQSDLREVVRAHYKAMETAFDDQSLVAPWDNPKNEKNDMSDQEKEAEKAAEEAEEKEAEKAEASEDEAAEKAEESEDEAAEKAEDAEKAEEEDAEKAEDGEEEKEEDAEKAEEEDTEKAFSMEDLGAAALAAAPLLEMLLGLASEGAEAEAPAEKDAEGAGEGVMKARRMTRGRMQQLESAKQVIENLISEFGSAKAKTEDAPTTKSDGAKEVAAMITKGILDAIVPRLEAVEKAQGDLDESIPAPKGSNPEKVAKNEAPVEKSNDEVFAGLFD